MLERAYALVPMTLVIQRPAAAVNDLLHRSEHTQSPLNSQLIVAADECVVVASNGAVLGVVPPGMHWVHPQPFPFLVPAIVNASVLQAELWFVKTQPVSGIAFGGALPGVREPGTKVVCACRTFGDFALVACDPARLVSSCVGNGMSDAAPVLAWVKQLVMRQFASAFASEVEGGKSLTSPGLAPAVLERVQGELGELDAMGLSVSRFGNATITLSEDDRAAVRDAKMQAVQEAMSVKQAELAGLRCTRCSKAHEGGRFCVDCGGSLAAG